MPLWSEPLARPLWTLVKLFVVWKSLLFLVAVCSPGPGYDTSTQLALSSRNSESQLPWLLRYVAAKMTRWDGIYFVTISNRGYLHEQEWAFGWGFTRLIALYTEVLTSFGLVHYDGLEAIVAISIAHIAHLFSVLLLFKLTSTVFTRPQPTVAFTAAALHIISPAGLFLSSPFAESCCAFLTFAGCLNFARSFGQSGQPTISHDLLLMLSGALFGAATAMRSNGIFSGLLLLEEAFRVLFSLRGGLSVSKLRRLATTGIGGVLVGAGFFLPQYIAYCEYCLDPSLGARPWCENAIPSIYTFVQDYYWNVGFLRYWTVSNLPLFVLAAPMFATMFVSGMWALGLGKSQTARLDKQQDTKINTDDTLTGRPRFLRSLGVSQLLLTALTLTTAHAQIITRISSSYPVWLWYIAIEFQKKDTKVSGRLVQFAVMYSIIQGGLFASFLPPA